MAQMPGMVNAMAQGQAQSGFGYKNAKDIYGMDDQARTQYWNSLNQYSAQNGGIDNSEFMNYVSGLSPDLRADFNATANGRHDYYLSPEARQRALQQQQAQDFRQNIPQMSQDLTGALRSQLGGAMSGGLHNIQQSNANRGLLYSGINEGQKAGYRANAQSTIAKASSDMNDQLHAAADKMDQQAIQSGQAIQQNAQQIQNQVYSQALARMNAQNQIAGSGMGLLGTAAIIAATAYGGPAGGAAAAAGTKAAMG